jgi:serine/threonine protein phosphatase PrpC
MQGWRRSMEDAHVAALDVCEDASCGVFAVMDGHGGAQVAR